VQRHDAPSQLPIRNACFANSITQCQVSRDITANSRPAVSSDPVRKNPLHMLACLASSALEMRRLNIAYRCSSVLALPSNTDRLTDRATIFPRGDGASAPLRHRRCEASSGWGRARDERPVSLSAVESGSLDDMNDLVRINVESGTVLCVPWLSPQRRRTRARSAWLPATSIRVPKSQKILRKPPTISILCSNQVRRYSWAARSLPRRSVSEGNSP
jgi:hypothetical protein